MISAEEGLALVRAHAEAERKGDMDERGRGAGVRVTIRHPATGKDEAHRVVVIFTFGPTRIAGERLYGSERFLCVLLGPAYAARAADFAGERAGAVSLRRFFRAGPSGPSA